MEVEPLVICSIRVRERKWEESAFPWILLLTWAFFVKRCNWVVSTRPCDRSVGRPALRWTNCWVPWLAMDILDPQHCLHLQHHSRFHFSPRNLRSRHTRIPARQLGEEDWQPIQNCGWGWTPLSQETVVVHETAHPNPLHATDCLHHGNLPSRHLRHQLQSLHQLSSHLW